jgi:hypothetical protein
VSALLTPRERAEYHEGLGEQRDRRIAEHSECLRILDYEATCGRCTKPAISRAGGFPRSAAATPHRSCGSSPARRWSDERRGRPGGVVSLRSGGHRLDFGSNCLE